MIACRGTLTVCAAVLAAGLVGTVGGSGQPPPPADRAVLELDLPAGATATIDGQPVGDRRRFTEEGLRPGEYRERRLRVTLPGGALVERTALLRGGWNARLRIDGPATNRPELVPQTGHTDLLRTFAVSPDGRLVATADDNACLVWDAETGRQLRRFVTVNDHFRAVTFAPDGQSLLTGLQHKVVHWDVKTGRAPRELPGLTRDVAGVVFSGGGRRALAWVDSGNEMLEWDLATGQSQRKLAGASDVYHIGAVTPDGRFAVTSGSMDTTNAVWDVSTGRQVSRISTADVPGITGADVHFAISPDGQRVVAWKDKVIAVWEAASGRLVRALDGNTDRIWGWGVAISADSRLLLTSSMSRTALWDVRTGALVQAIPAHDDPLLRPTFTPDGKSVFADRRRLTPEARDIGLVKLDVATGERRALKGGRYRKADHLAFAADGQSLLTGWHGWDATSAVLWDLTAGRPRWRQRFQIENDLLTALLTGMLFVPGGREVGAIFVRGGNGRPLEIVLTRLSEESGQRRSDVVAHQTPTRTGEFQYPRWAGNKDGRRLVVWDNFGAEVYDVITGRTVSTLKTNVPPDGGACISPDGRLVVTAATGEKAAVREADRRIQDAGGTVPGLPTGIVIQVWDADSGRLLRTLRHPVADIVPLDFTPDGRRLLASAGQPGQFHLWDVDNGRDLGDVTVPDARSDHAPVAFTPDSRLVVLARTDNALVVWDLEAKRARHVLRGHSGEVNALAVAPDGRRLASAARDGTVRLWDLATGEELGCLFNLGDGAEWLAVTPDGLFDGSTAGREQIAFRVGGGLNVVPVDRFFQDFFRPGLLAQLVRGDAPRPDADFGARRPPTVRVVAPKADAVVESERVTVEAEVTDEGGGVQGPVLFHNGARIVAPGRSEREGRVVRRSFPLALAPGENVLEVRAATADGSWDAEPARVTLRYEKPVQRPNLVLLAVGISRYARDPLKLKFAAADARALADVFRTRGRQLYQDVVVRTLTDAEATKAGIRAALEDLARRTLPQDTLVAFLAGHGTTVGQRYYFLPHEFAPRDGEPLEGEVRKQGLPGDELGDWLCAAPARKRVVVFDTCHSGAAVVASGREPFALRGAVERLSRSTGLYTLAAAAAGDEAKEVDELGHGVLSYVLLAGLGAVDRGPLADQAIRPGNAEQVVDVLEWFSYATGQVPRLTKRYFGREQDVQFSNEGRNFPILPLKGM
jgi:WD40 repeat protein